MESTILLEAIRVLGLALFGFLVALIITPFITPLLLKKQIRSSGDAPIYSKMHAPKNETPTMGGVIIWLTVLGLAGLFWVLSLLFGGFFDFLNFVDRGQTYLPMASMLIAAFLGATDDLLGAHRIGPKGGGLSITQKLVAYFLVALVGALWFYYRLNWDVLNIPFIGSVVIGWWYVPLFIFIIVASAHSANLTDGLDGLLGGVLLFAFLALTAVAFAIGRYDLATFSGVVSGALLAFLWFNIYPARFFMGDTGSMALGITMGIIAMLTNTTLLLPLFAAVLVIEALSVIIQSLSKKFRGRKVFLSTPIHHHFEAIGWPETKVTMRFWIISAVFTALGLAIFFISRVF
jgi:phospho-N-acetylmuramoyl-pentapeptide-transferase